LQDAGIEPISIIVAGTKNAGIFLGMGKDFGSFEPGKVADFVLVDEDPTKDINHLKKISAVVKDGKVIDRSRLELPVNRKAPSGRHTLNKQ